MCEARSLFVNTPYPPPDAAGGSQAAGSCRLMCLALGGQGLLPVVRPLNTWLQPFLLFLLSFAVGAAPSKHLMTISSQFF